MGVLFQIAGAAVERARPKLDFRIIWIVDQYIDICDMAQSVPGG